MRLALHRDDATVDDMLTLLYRLGTVVDIALDSDAMTGDCSSVTVHVDRPRPVRTGVYPPGHA